MTVVRSHVFYKMPTEEREVWDTAFSILHDRQAAAARESDLAVMAAAFRCSVILLNVKQLFEAFYVQKNVDPKGKYVENYTRTIEEVLEISGVSRTALYKRMRAAGVARPDCKREESLLALARRSRTLPKELSRAGLSVDDILPLEKKNSKSRPTAGTANKREASLKSRQSSRRRNEVAVEQIHAQSAR